MRFEVSLSSKIQSVFITEFIPAGIVRIMAMGLSRNKVAVPEGAAGTPPFWSFISKVSCLILQRKF